MKSRIEMWWRWRWAWYTWPWCCCLLRGGMRRWFRGRVVENCPPVCFRATFRSRLRWIARIIGGATRGHYGMCVSDTGDRATFNVRLERGKSDGGSFPGENATTLKLQAVCALQYGFFKVDQFSSNIDIYSGSTVSAISPHQYKQIVNCDLSLSS